MIIIVLGQKNMQCENEYLSYFYLSTKQNLLDINKKKKFNQILNN